MNIFFVDFDPRLAAQALADKHVVKMILESAQMLSTAHRVLDGEDILAESDRGRKVHRWHLADDREDILYKATHINHPCSVWIRESVENYNWLVDHMYALIAEYQCRYGKIHKVYDSGLAYTLASPPYNLKDWDFTNPPCVMPAEYLIGANPVANYRNYYRLGKKHLHQYEKGTSEPDWL